MRWGRKGRKGWRDEVDEELAFHLEMRRRSLQEQGLSEEAADREARRRFGPVRPIRDACVEVNRREEVRRMWSGMWSGTGLDVRVALRQFARRPGYVAVVIATFALAVGGNTAAFSLLNSIVLQPTPFEGGDRLVRMWLEPQEGILVTPSSELSTRWRERARIFDEFGTLGIAPRLLTGRGDPETLGTATATPSLLEAFGMRPFAGRLLGASDARAGAAPVAVISERLWTTRLDGASDVIGQGIDLDGETHTVVGVVGPEIRRLFASSALGRGDVDAWLPAPDDRDATASGTVIGILREGVTREQAVAELEAIAAQAVEDGDLEVEWPVRLSTQEALATSPLARTLWVVFACVGMVLLIACLNIGGVQIARGIERGGEFELRSAIGASRAGLVRQLATEGLLLSGVGALIGVALAYWGVPMLGSTLGAELPELRTVHLDLRVLVFALVATAGASFVSGIAPGILISRRAGRVSGARTSTVGRGDVRLGRLLVGGEVALTIVLLVAAGLFLTSYRHLRNVDPGFDPGRLIVLSLSADSVRYPTAPERAAFYASLRERFQGLPAVGAVSLATGSPDRLPGYYGVLVPEDRWSEPREDASVLRANWVDPGYFRAIGAPIVEGREPVLDAPEPEVVISRSAARVYFGEDAPLGRRFALWTPFAADNPPEWRRVVGITESVRPEIVEDPGPQIYLSLDSGEERATFLVRAVGSPSDALPALREAAWAIDDRIPVDAWSLMAERVQSSIIRQSITAKLTAAFGAIALLIAIVGVYGAVLLDSDRRVRENAIRLALGARPAELRRRMIWTSMAPVMVGLAGGLIGAGLAAGALTSLLWGISPREPMVFLLAPAVLGLTSWAAALAPTRQVLRLDPARTLTEGGTAGPSG